MVWMVLATSLPNRRRISGTVNGIRVWSPTGRACSRAAMTVRMAWASMTRVVCRYQESQRRTWGSSRPMVFAGLEAGLHVPPGPRHRHQGSQRNGPGRPAAVEGQFAVADPAADEQAVAPGGLVVGCGDGDPAPVVVPLALGPGAGGQP